MSKFSRNEKEAFNRLILKVVEFEEAYSHAVDAACMIVREVIDKVQSAIDEAGPMGFYGQSWWDGKIEPTVISEHFEPMLEAAFGVENPDDSDELWDMD